MMAAHHRQETAVTIPLVPVAVALLLLWPARPAGTQEPVIALQRHAVYLEVGGNASRYSINYERAFNARHRLRVGGAIWTDGESAGQITETELNFPLMYNLLFQRGAHHLELGAGVLVGAWDKLRDGDQSQRATYWSATGTIGYRHQVPANEWLFRIGFTPIYGFGDEADAYPRKGFATRFGVSIGRAFN